MAADMTIRIALAMLLAPVTLLYLLGVEDLSAHHDLKGSVQALLAGMGFSALWWCLFKCHDMTFRRIPKYIWISIAAGILAPVHKIWAYHNDPQFQEFGFIYFYSLSVLILAGAILLLLIWRNGKHSEYAKIIMNAAGAVIIAFILYYLYRAHSY